MHEDKRSGQAFLIYLVRQLRSGRAIPTDDFPPISGVSIPVKVVTFESRQTSCLDPPSISDHVGRSGISATSPVSYTPLRNCSFARRRLRNGRLHFGPSTTNSAVAVVARRRAVSRSGPHAQSLASSGS